MNVEDFVILYRIINRRDGRWVVAAFDRNLDQIGMTIEVATPSEAWRIWMILNGYCDLEPTEILETQGVAV